MAWSTLLQVRVNTTSLFSCPNIGSHLSEELGLMMDSELDVHLSVMQPLPADNCPVPGVAKALIPAIALQYELPAGAVLAVRHLGPSSPEV